jgi:hypothetical protein
MKINQLFEDGVITAYNTTVDVKPGETERQAKKFFGGNGKPLPLGAKGATPNQAFNLGLTENMSVTGTERRRSEKKKGIEIGTPEWFKHWFDLPYLREDITKQELLAKLKDQQRGRYIKAMLDAMHQLVQSKGARHSIGNYAYEIAKTFGYSPKDLEKMYRDTYDVPHDSMVRTEDVTQPQLNALEKAVDNVFGRIGIDVEFTRHFLDRANDERNGEPITIQELGKLFAKEYKRWGKPIAQMGPDTEAVMKDLESDINIPFALRWNGTELELIAKTVMRKKNFSTSNKQFPVENTQGSLAQKINWGGQNKPAKKPTPSKQQDMSWWQKLQQRAGINEVLDNPSAYTWSKDQFGFPTATAKELGLNIHFDGRNEPSWEVSFNRKQKDGSIVMNQPTGQGKEFQVFATVKAAVLEFMNKYPDVHDLSLDARKDGGKDDQGRVNLYRRMMKQYANKLGWEYDEFDQGSLVTFEISSKPRTDENFADGKKKGKSKPGRVKKSGASCDGSVTSLRKKAKNSSGEKAKMYHWCANMKAGKKK